jgi:phosphate transport system substrate-binding protein
MDFKAFYAHVAGTVFSLAMITSGSLQAETLRIGGTGVALGGMALLAEAFEKTHEGTTVTVLPSLGSSGGVRALTAGAIDLSVSSRPLKAAETEQGAEATLYATTPVAIVTSKMTTDDTITLKQLEQMYAGEVTQWSSGQPVRVVLRPKNETDTKMLVGLSDEMAVAMDAAQERPGMLRATNDQENAETLESIAGSLGVVALGQIATEKRQLKTLTLGETETASADGGQNELYSKQLFVVQSKNPSDLAKLFVEFIFSNEAQSILSATDHTPKG